MAVRTVANGGGFYDVAGTWVEGAVPTNADDVVFTGTSGQLTVRGVTACKSINFTNYTNIFTINYTLTISGAVTFVPGFTFNTTASNLAVFFIIVSSTITSNGVTFPYNWSFGGISQIYTLADDLRIGMLYTSGGTTGTTINGFKMYIGGGFTQYAVTVSGTTEIVMNGTGTINWTGASVIKNNFTFNTTGTITIPGNFHYNTGTLTYITGTVITTGSTLTCILSTTLNTGGIIWETITFGGTSQIYTLTSNITCTGQLSANSSTTMCTLNGFTAYVGGTLSLNRAINGTTNIIMNGSGNIAGIFPLTNNLTINTAGSYTITSFIYMTGTFTYTAGTITGTPTLVINGSCILNTAGINWTSVSIGVTATITNNSLLTIETLTWTGAAIATNAFDGTAGFTVGTMTNNGAQRTYTLKNGLTYTVTTAHTSIISTAAIHNVFASDSGTIKAILTYQQGATFDLSFFDFTRIDASNGLTIEPYKGTITDCLNVRLLPVDIQQLSF